MYTLALLALFAAQPSPQSTRESPIKLKLDGEPGIEVEIGEAAAGRIQAAKLTTQQWNAILRVAVVGKANEKMPAIAGTYTVKGSTIRFEPQFPFDSSVGYRAEFNPKGVPGGTRTPASRIAFTLPKPPAGMPTTVAAVFPTANRLPENTLRFYIHFSGQMSQANVYRYLKLVRDDGHEVVRPFLELDEGLWSADGLRLTVLLHPGRVKQGLVPREEEGPILEAGRRFSLVISKEWKDAEGRPFPVDIKKTFTVGPPDDEPIDIEKWALIAPRAGSYSPVILRLAKPLDHALLGSTVRVVDSSGKMVEGETTVGGGERVVTFAPANPWQRGELRLVIDKRLEDVCGNRVGEPFEVEADSAPARPIVRERRFTVK